MKRIFALVLFCVGISVSYAVELPSEFEQYQLENGLTVYLWEDHDSPQVHGWTITRAGSVDEPEDATGLAHYLEHMLFKGTDQIGALDWEKERPYYEHIIALYDTLAQTADSKEREAIQLKINAASIASAQYGATDEFSNLIQSIGGEDLNAFTSYDQTCYMNSFPAHQMERWLTLYSDRLIHPVFRSFQAELENVFEEYNMYQDNNMQHVSSFVSSHLYTNHAYARDIIGYPEDLKNPKLRKLIEFYNTWYVPGNMALVLVGDFEIASTKPLIAKTFGRLEAKEVPVRKTYGTTDFSQAERYTAKLGYMPMLLIGWEGVKVGDPDELPLNFAAELLSNSMQVGMLDKLAMESKLMFAGMALDSRRDLGRIELQAVPYMDPSTQKYSSLSSTESLVRAEIQKLIAGDYSDELLETIRLHLCQQYDRVMEYPEMKVNMIMNSFSYQIPISEMLTEKERYMAITREDITRVAKKYLTRPDKTFEIEEGNPHKDKLPKPKIKPLTPPIAESMYAQAFDSIPATKLTPRFTDVSDVNIARFYDEVSVFVTPNPKNSIFSLRLKYGVGTYQRPMLEYATQMMAFAGIKGLPGKSAHEFRSELAALGAKVNYSADASYMYVDIEGEESNLAQIVDLVKLHMLFANFSSENDAIINNIKGQVYSSRTVEQKNSDIVADAAYEYVLYGEHSPYLRRPSLKEVLELTPAVLESEFHRALDYALEIHYAGQLPVDSVHQILASLPMSEHAHTSASPIERPRKQAENMTYMLDNSEMQQAKIYFYIDGTPYQNTEAVQYMAFNEYFGGGFSGVVMNEIREKRSMAYTAVGYFRRPKVQGRSTYFIGYVGTQPDKVADAVDVYRSLLDSMPANPNKVTDIKNILRQSLLSNKPTFRTKSQRLTDWYRMGYTIDPATLQIRNVQRLQYADIDNFYRKNIQGKPATLLIIGDPKLIDIKTLKAKYGKINKLTKSRIFSPSGL